MKTLHPRIHAGILARRDLPEDMETLAEHGIEPFDLVCVNLYPFASVAGRRGVTEEEAIEMIDVGGPSMLRAAAKNFALRGARLPARAVQARPGRAARGRRPLDPDAPHARDGGVRDDGGLRRHDRGLVRRDGALPRAADPQLPEDRRPRVRREPAPALRLLRRGGLAAAPALARRAARRQGALVQQPRRPRRAPAASCASSRCRPR